MQRVGIIMRYPIELQVSFDMIAIIDNYDSFTYNLVQRLGEIDPQLDLAVFRNDQIGLDQLEVN